MAVETERDSCLPCRSWEGAEQTIYRWLLGPSGSSESLALIGIGDKEVDLEEKVRVCLNKL